MPLFKPYFLFLARRSLAKKLFYSGPSLHKADSLAGRERGRILVGDNTNKEYIELQDKEHQKQTDLISGLFLKLAKIHA
jgi:hypothetical protein